ncbi:MAG: outer membrane beta-barrel protein [Gemmatimonadales bacterium]
MKRWSGLVLLLLALMPAVSAAQRGRLDRLRRVITRDDYVEIGLVGGVNWSTLTGSDRITARVSGTGGGFLSVPVAGSLRLRPELSVDNRRVESTRDIIPPCLPPGPCPPIEERQVATFTWLEAPVLAEWRMDGALGRSLRPRIYGGPFVAIRLGCSFTTPVEGGGSTSFVVGCGSPDVGNQYHNGDAGFILGGAIASGGLGIGARWIRSLVPVAPAGSNPGAGYLLGAKSSTLVLTMEFGTRLY